MVTTIAPATTDRNPEDLGRFRFHTGGQPRRLDPDEPCPALFRDLGFEAMGRFLQGELRRLCGPLSPITYLRTAEYREPYVDHGRIGRVMLLQPRQVRPWHSGIEAVFIAGRETAIEAETMVFLPDEISPAEAAMRYRDVRTRDELTEAVGRLAYQAAADDTLARLTELQHTHEETERLAAPLRRLFQSMNRRDRERAARWMQRVGLNETDLCMAWHHLPAMRRDEIRSGLRELPKELP